MRVSEVAEATGAELLLGRGDDFLPEISTDTRALTKGKVFLPLNGERFRGQDFVAAAAGAGAAGFFTEDWGEELENLTRRYANIKVVLRVTDGNRALMEIARLARKKITGQVAAVTGSSGKTSTKELAASIVSLERKVFATSANYNNEIGVPLTIIKAPPEVECLILEMGMRGLGQIRELAEIASPTIGLVTNIGMAHLESLGDTDRVASAKGELLEAIPADGVAVINADDVYAGSLVARCRGGVLSFGLSPAADFRATDITFDDQARAGFVLRCPAGKCDIALRTSGRHWITNALAAAALAAAAGVSLANIQKGLCEFEAPVMRSEIIDIDGLKIINDAYNANPDSMAAALALLKDIRAEGKRVAILGDMAELGKEAGAAHRQIGEMVSSLGIDRLVTVGELSEAIADVAANNGFDRGAIVSFQDTTAAERRVSEIVDPGDVVLVKGSRFMEMERLVERLRGKAGA